MRIQWAPGSNFFWLFFSNTAETYPISIFQLWWFNGCLFVLSQKLRCLHKDWTTLLEELCYQHCSSNYVVNFKSKLMTCTRPSMTWHHILRESLILHLLFQERYAPSHMWLYTDHILPYNRKHRKKIVNVVKLKTQTLSWYNLQAQWNFQGTAHFPQKLVHCILELRWCQEQDWAICDWLINRSYNFKADKNCHKYRVDLVVIISWNENFNHVC